jgi:hypothetical protein
MAPIRVLLRYGLLLCFFACRTSHATADYQLEAVFLFNFTQFVEWPSSAFARDDSPLSICVLGEDPFGNYLDDIVRGENAGHHPLIVERHRNADTIGHCHILFFSQSEAESFRRVLQGIKSNNVLTVGGFQGFANNGGIIRFHIVDNKLRLRVNLNAAHDARLTISSKLLRQAELIGYGED